LGAFTDGITHEKLDKLKQYIEAAKDCIRHDPPDWDAAIKALQDILDEPKDWQVEVTRKNEKTGHETISYVNAKFEANRLIGELAEDGLNAYEGKKRRRGPQTAGDRQENHRPQRHGPGGPEIQAHQGGGRGQ